MKKPPLLSNFFKSFTNPYSSDLPLFLVLLLLQLVQVYCNIKVLGGSGIVIFLSSIGVSYIVTLVLSWIKPRFLKQILAFVAFAICWLISIVQLFCAVCLKKIFDASDLVIAGDTNPEEAIDFLQTYVTMPFLAFAIVLALFCAALYFAARKLPALLGSNSKIIATLLSIVLFLFSIASKNIDGTGIGQSCQTIAFFVTKYEKGYDLYATQTIPDIEEISHQHPQNIILIIGESYDKNHSGLYGYDKNTTPFMNSLVSDSSMIIFRNVKSSAPSTMLSFKLMMSTLEDFRDNNWQCKVMLPTTMRKAGYLTHWISNQTQNGVNDNVVSRFAYLCNSYIFISDDTKKKHTHYFDEEIIPHFSKELNARDPTSRHLYVLHLMGSHVKYEKRYPKKFYHFKPSDYPNHPLNQRETLAAYDNSIIYNDRVVYDIIQQIDTMEAIVMYFPDHGEDIYHTRPDYAGHGIITNPESLAAGCQIPFLIYLTEKYKSRFPNSESIMRNHVDDNFETTNLIWTLLDIAGFSIDEMTSEKSLFKADFLNAVTDSSIKETLTEAPKR